MKMRKVAQTNDIIIEAWKCLGDKQIVWLLIHFNKKITENIKILDVWGKSILVFHIITKRDIQSCIKLQVQKL